MSLSSVWCTICSTCPFAQVGIQFASCVLVWVSPVFHVKNRERREEALGDRSVCWFRTTGLCEEGIEDQDDDERREKMRQRIERLRDWETREQKPWLKCLFDSSLSLLPCCLCTESRAENVVCIHRAATDRYLILIWGLLSSLTRYFFLLFLCPAFHSLIFRGNIFPKKNVFLSWRRVEETFSASTTPVIPVTWNALIDRMSVKPLSLLSSLEVWMGWQFEFAFSPFTHSSKFTKGKRERGVEVVNMQWLFRCRCKCVGKRWWEEKD